MANKNARILWVVMTRGQGLDARHVSVKPQTEVALKERQAAAASPLPTSLVCAATA